MQLSNNKLGLYSKNLIPFFFNRIKASFVSLLVHAKLEMQNFIFCFSLKNFLNH